jgi:hypothetical protein
MPARMRAFAVAVLLAGCAPALGAAPSPSPTAAPSPVPPKAPTPGPARSVPDQPYVGTPEPGEKPYLSILKAREAGASNEALLARVRREKVVYSLTTYDLRRLRAAGVSPAVIEAMLRSGRSRTTPAPVLPAQATPRRTAPAATPTPPPN